MAIALHGLYCHHTNSSIVLIEKNASFSEYLSTVPDCQFWLSVLTVSSDCQFWLSVLTVSSDCQRPELNSQMFNLLQLYLCKNNVKTGRTRHCGLLSVRGSAYLPLCLTAVAVSCDCQLWLSVVTDSCDCQFWLSVVTVSCNYNEQ